MKTFKDGSRMTGEEILEILDLVPDEFQAGVLDGTLIIRPRVSWYNQQKPVIVESANNHIKYGRYRAASNIGEISKLTSYKRKRGYKEMQQIYIGAEPNEHELQLISLKEVIDALWDACNGSPQYIDCPHPELHVGRDATPLRHVVGFKKDPNALFKLYENIVGKATETSEINVNQTALIKMLQDTTPLTELHVIDLPPDQIYERKRLLESSEEPGDFKHVE